eukprot:3523408-Rhodomonas_salina.2
MATVVAIRTHHQIPRQCGHSECPSDFERKALIDAVPAGAKTWGHLPLEECGIFNFDPLKYLFHLEVPDTSAEDVYKLLTDAQLESSEQPCQNG